MTKDSAITYRRHTIKTLINASGAQARAFRSGQSVGDVFRGNDLEEAVGAVKEFLDARFQGMSANRTTDGVPTAEEFAEATRHVAISDGQRAMLRAHLAAPGYVLTATDLANAAGYKDYSAANLQYGKLAFDLGQELEWTPAPDASGEIIWTFVIAIDADGEDARASSSESKMWRWRLRPEVVEAVEGILA